MVDLPCGERLIPAGGEMPRHTDILVREDTVLGTVDRVAIEPGCRRPHSKHDARSRWLAHRRLAVGIGKQDAPFRQPINIWGPRIRMSVKAADPIVQIIDRNEQHIRRSLLLRINVYAAAS